MNSRLQFATLVATGIAIVVLPALRGLQAQEPATVPTFGRDVQPIFKSRCVKCHSEKTRKAELDLSGAEGIVRGGESGAALGAESPEDSLLLSMVEERLMPPEGEEPLTKSQIDVIRRWIQAGAKFDSPPGSPSEGSDQVTQADVLPLVLRRCWMCHGPEYQFGGVDLRTRESMLLGGDNGPALAPGAPDESLMVQRVRKKLCPPKPDIGEAGIEPMRPDELSTLVNWIQQGAPAGDLHADVATGEPDPLVSDEDRRFWSFQPPQKPPAPHVSQRGASVRTPIDAFVLAKLAENGLAFSPEADPTTLVRRAAFALTGLPPEPGLVERFQQDDSPLAFGRLVDRLLASPHYGEKWARFWLDLAGYADSEGKRNADMIRPSAWKYRDWVIRAFNDDKPYDQFLLEQIAGDELVDWADEDAVDAEVIDKLTATGFLRMAPDGTSADPVNRFTDRLEVISDEIDVFGRGVLGLTLNCARCHSHKYDPIPQRDYYRLVAVFKGAYDEYDWLTPQPFGNQWNKAQRRHLVVMTPAERRKMEAHNAPIDEEIAALKKELAKKDLSADRKKSLQKEVKALQAGRREPSKIRALWDRGRPSPTFLYRRGDLTQPSRLVGPGVPVVLTDGRKPFAAQPPEHSSPKTGRRLTLARWLTRPDHPLTARVIVNRLWHQHFGRGIVQSLDNFGRSGTPPSHPELLDWLAVEFVEHGWSIKHLHRLILTSTVWRQSSRIRPEHERLDPDNRLLSRMPMRRLSAEEVRDAILFAAGRLSGVPFGPPDAVEVRNDGLVTSKPTDGLWRRSVYVRQRRKEMPTLFETFDLPQMTPNCTDRKTSTIVTQPLHLLNNRMIHDLAAAFANRVVREAGDAREAQIQQAFRLALGRSPTPDERQASLAALQDLQRNWQNAGDDSAARRPFADFCHALLNSANFLYVD